jgi:antitoxin component YwqK of YwqJK toxin-antitoxin module
MVDKIFIPRKLSSNDSRYTDHNNSQPMVDGKRINQYNIDGNKEGYWEIYWENGNLDYRGNYVAGKEDGIWESYFSNGEFYSKGFYVAGKKYGYWEFYNSNGDLGSKGNYVDGKFKSI